MKSNNQFSLALVGTVAVSLLPALGYADQKEDGNKENRKEWKKHRHELQVQNVAQPKGHFQKENSQNALRTESASTGWSVSVAPQERRYRSGSPSEGYPQRAYVGSRSSREFWVPENVYHGWDRQSRHYYNHHYYGWHNGSWVIIDAGVAPEYYGRDSIVSRVQARLAQRGYYRGPVDGDAGPGTRNAIAGYQADHDLRVTGQINDALLESLRLE